MASRAVPLRGLPYLEAIMIRLRRSEQRGGADYGWLQTRYSFSFADYFDPAHMGVSVLRVINDDHIAPSGGFPTHDHANMEIITYLLEGRLEHRDSTGSRLVIEAGEVQRMSAGSGISHSEFNPDDSRSTHLLQIWIRPKSCNIEPGYQQKPFPASDKKGRLRLIASPDGRDGSLEIHQDALLHAAILDQSDEIHYEPGQGRTLYLHVARGELNLNGERLQAGDGATVTDEADGVRLHQAEDAEVLLFDLP